MNLSIDPQIISLFPQVKVGVLIASGLKQPQNTSEITALLRQAEEGIKKQYTVEKLGEVSKIADWREAYRLFGMKPSEYRSSLEALARRVLQGKELPSINSLVDIYNIISLRHMLPLGGGDLSGVVGDITLTRAQGDERFVMLGAQTPTALQKGEVVYRDANEVLCRSWNYRECDKSKLTQSTVDAYFVIEGLAHTSMQEIKAALDDLQHLLSLYCGGTYQQVILHRSRRDLLNTQVADIEPEEAYESKEHKIRLQKVKKLEEQGIKPWPEYKEVTHTATQIINEFKDDGVERQYTVAGRLMSKRLHGKTAFAHIQDVTGKIQIYLKIDIVGEKAFKEFEDLIDVGDILWCSGISFKTKMGEVTLQVREFTLLSKCLHPLPEKFHGISDIETKYRQRYLDLITSADTRNRFMKRSKIVSAIRSYLDTHGYIEVETPMLHPIAGGAAARPFITHHNTLNTDFYLRIAPELYLKRLVVGGFERVYEINRNFRNEGVSTKHNPEFTMVEFYTAYKDYHYSMDFTENILRYAAQQACGALQVPYGDHLIDFETPFKRLSVKEAVMFYGELSEQDISPEHIDATIKRLKLSSPAHNSAGQKLFVLFDALVEKKLIQPTFIIDFPIETSPLAKASPADSQVAARFELFISGMELSNSYNELNNPFDQAQRFKDQLTAYAAGDQEAHQYDAEFVQALEYGLPPTVGVGIGIDRLVMLLTNTTSIKEVILFPALKKKE